MSRKGGRPKSKSWDELSFIPTKDDNGKNAALCTVCNKLIHNTAEVRLQMHRNKCLMMDDMDIDKTQISEMSFTDQIDNIDADNGQQYLNNNSIDENQSLMINNVKVDTKEQRNTKKGNSMRNGRITSYIDFINVIEKEKIDEALSKFFYGCNVQFDVIESDYFKNFIKSLRPAYVLPESKELSTTLLEKAFDKLQKRCNNYENAPGILILCIKKHYNRKSVLLIIRDLDGENIFLKCCNLLTTGRNLEKELSEITARAIDLTKNVHSLNVFAVLSEKIVQIDNYQNIHFIKCNVKVAQCIAKLLNNMTLFDKIYDIFQECTENSFLWKNCYYDFKKLPLVDQSKSWTTHFQIFRFFLDNVNILRKLADQHMFKSNIITMLFDQTLYLEVKELYGYYLSLAQLIEIFNKKDYYIGDAVESWIDLKSNTENILISEFLDKQWNEIMQPVSLAANLLDPKYRGQRLTDQQIIQVQDFLLDNVDKNGLDQLDAYKVGKGMFSKLFEKKVKSMKTFWDLVKPECPELSQFAIKILHIPAACIDFACHFVEQKQLSDEKSDQLISVYYDLRIRDSKQE